MTTQATATRLGAPVAIAVVVVLGDLFDAAIGLSTYRDSRGPAIPGASSWASMYLLGVEAGAGALILLLAVVAAGRSRVAAGAAAGLAWLRLLAVAAVGFLMVLGLGFAAPHASDVFLILLALIDAVAGILICTSLARRTRRRLG